MKTRSTRTLEVLSISALDLFASALGVFMLVALLLFPFYLKAPSVEASLAGARLENAEAEAERARAEREATEARAERIEAQTRAEQARADLALAEEDRAAAETALHQAQANLPQPVPAPAVAPPPPAPISPRRAGGSAVSIGDLDLVFVMDTTGSMRHEINDVRRSLISIIRVFERLTPSLRIGFVAFKDRTDAYLTQTVPLMPMTKSNLARMQSFVKQLSATGGGDRPEPIELALQAAITMPWRKGAKGRIVVISDAPAHHRDWQRTFAAAAGFHGSNPGGRNDRRVSAILTGRTPQARDFYQRLSAAGGGDLVSHRGQMLESILLSVL